MSIEDRVKVLEDEARAAKTYSRITWIMLPVAAIFMTIWGGIAVLAAFP